MSALSAARDTKKWGSSAGPVMTYFQPPAQTNKIFYPGAIVCLDQSTGYAIPGATSTTLKPLGRCAETETLDMTSIASGTNKVKVEPGVFKYVNGDTIVDTDIGSVFYVGDDQTVYKGSGGSTRSIGGYIVEVDSDGVWVQFAFGVW